MSGFIRHSDDDLTDIKDIPLDHFWRKCIENLPEGWQMRLIAMPGEGEGLRYYAVAELMEAPPPRPHFSTMLCRHPERALEKLFYQLRDFL